MAGIRQSGSFLMGDSTLDLSAVRNSSLMQRFADAPLRTLQFLNGTMFSLELPAGLQRRSHNPGNPDNQEVPVERVTRLETEVRGIFPPGPTRQELGLPPTRAEFLRMRPEILRRLEREPEVVPMPAPPVPAPSRPVPACLCTIRVAPEQEELIVIDPGLQAIRRAGAIRRAEMGNQLAESVIARSRCLRKARPRDRERVASFMRQIVGELAAGRADAWTQGVVVFQRADATCLSDAGGGTVDLGYCLVSWMLLELGAPRVIEVHEQGHVDINMEYFINQLPRLIRNQFDRSVCIPQRVARDESQLEAFAEQAFDDAVAGILNRVPVGSFHQDYDRETSHGQIGDSSTQMSEVTRAILDMREALRGVQ